ncbi:MAG: Clp1/GlmU family protein [Saccharolobus sp.]
MKKEIIVEGPCGIKVLDGEISILGIRIGKGESIEITRNKTYTIVYDSSTKIDMNCKIIVDNIFLDWDQKAEEIFNTGGTVLLLGDTDSGKTYFINLISNIAEPHVKIIDSDVGQSSLFLPTFVAELRPNMKSLSVEELGYEKIDFFGDITPSINPKLHVEMLVHLYESTPSEKVVAIDTDGWVKGYKAMLHKFELIYSIDPDYIVIFDNKMRDLLPTRYRKNVITLKGIGFFHKNRSQRRMYRISKYKEYFKRAQIISVQSEDLLGYRISDVLYSGWGDYLQIIPEEPCIGYYTSLDILRGALLGVVKKREVIGAALLKDIKGDQLEILSNITDFSGLILGYISLNDSFEERRIRFRRCKN